MRILLNVHKFTLTAKYHEPGSGTSTSLFDEAFHAVFDASVTELIGREADTYRSQLNLKLNRMLKRVRVLSLDEQTVDDIRKAASFINDKSQISEDSRDYFNYWIKRLLLPTVDVKRRSWVVSWTNLRREERARAERYEFTNAEESSITFGQISARHLGKSNLGKLEGRHMSHVLKYM